MKPRSSAVIGRWDVMDVFFCGTEFHGCGIPDTPNGFGIGRSG